MSQTNSNLSVPQRLFIAGILTIGVALFLSAAFVYLKPAPPPRNVAREAKNLLRSVKATPLSEDLKHYIETGDGFFVDSQELPLVGKPAPEFRLLNHLTERIDLQELLKKGPVVIVYYLGYSCDHCVSQLFGLAEDLRYFNELNATIVAISPDSPEKTSEKFKQYGTFPFPVLSDADLAYARKLGVVEPPAPNRDEMLLHGTFVVGADGIVRWGKTGDNPFYHNPTLLRELARSRDQLLSAKSR